MIPPNVKLGLVIFVIFLCTVIAQDEKIFENSLSMGTMIKDVCSRTLSRLIFRICSGHMQISELPDGKIATIRGKRAALLFKYRVKRQVADECCKNACSVAQLLEYCPDTW